jgi:hypothetical protein
MNIGTAFAIPEITKQPKTGVVKYGSTVILECSVFGSYHNYEMIWFKVQSDERHVKQRSTKQSIWSSDPDKNIQRQRLTIFNFNEDKAEYYCQVKRYAVNHVGKATIQLHLEGKWMFLLKKSFNAVRLRFKMGSTDKKDILPCHQYSSSCIQLFTRTYAFFLRIDQASHFKFVSRWKVDCDRGE